MSIHKIARFNTRIKETTKDGINDLLRAVNHKRRKEGEKKDLSMDKFCDETWQKIVEENRKLIDKFLGH